MPYGLFVPEVEADQGFRAVAATSDSASVPALVPISFNSRAITAPPRSCVGHFNQPTPAAASPSPQMARCA